MEYIKIAGTSLTTSRAVLGTMTFGAQLDEDGSRRAIDIALEYGINHIDTANSYTDGASEEIVGRALGARREKVILATKAFNPVRGVQGLDRRSIRRALEDSLRRLGTDYVDLFYLHQPDWNTPIEETLAALQQLIDEGKVRYPAISNYAAWQVAEIRAIQSVSGFAPTHVAQLMYNAITRDIEQEYASFAERFDMSTFVYNPLAGGLLTGKYASISDKVDPGSRFSKAEYRARYWSDRQFAAAGTVAKLATEWSTDPVSLSLGWVLAQPTVTGVILGASSIEQLESNLAAVETEFDPIWAEQLDGVWRELRGSGPAYNR